MTRCSLIFLILVASAGSVAGHGFEMVDRQETYQAAISGTVQIPVRIKNTSEKAQFYVVRNTSTDLGSDRKGYFCLGKNCLEQGVNEFTKRVEPGETVDLNYTL